MSELYLRYMYNITAVTVRENNIGAPKIKKVFGTLSNIGKKKANTYMAKIKSSEEKKNKSDSFRAVEVKVGSSRMNN